MPRKSPYAILLTAEEQRRLKALARQYTLPYRDVVRAKIVLYAAAGWDNDQIAARLDTSRQIVSKWRKRFYKERLAGLEELARQGRTARLFPPQVVVAIKALACQLPRDLGLPLSRFSVDEIKRAVTERGLVATIGGTTLWRWLREDAIRPWYHRSWIFPRDPNFAEKAGRILDLYAGGWQGESLTDDDYVLSTDEKTSIQARRRLHPSLPSQAGEIMKVEFEYERLGAWAYFAAWDVRRAKIYGRCEKKSGIAPFERLLEQVLNEEPYRSARRVFLVMDNGSSHRGERCAARLKKRWPLVTPVHTPVHASWLNQVEIYFSIIQRKVLTPNDFRSLVELRERLTEFEHHYEKVARPFEWKFTRADLEKLLKKLNEEAQSQVA